METVNIDKVICSENKGKYRVFQKELYNVIYVCYICCI